MKLKLLYTILFIFIAMPFLLLLAEGEKTGQNYFDLAAGYEEKGDYENALINYDKAIAAQKKSGKPVPYYFYSSAGYVCWNEFRDFKKALGYFLAVYNGDYPAKDKDKHIQNIAHLYYKCGEYDEFLRYADEYLKTGMKDEYKRKLHDLLANYYYNRGEAEKALAHAKQAGPDFRMTKMLQERNVALSFKFRFRELVQKYRKKMTDSRTIFIEAPLDTYYQKLVSVKSNPPFKRIVKKERMNWLEFDFSKGLPETLKIECVVNIRIISRSPLNVRQYNDKNDGIGYYAHEKRSRHGLEYDLDNPILVDAVNEITKDRKTIYEKIKALNGWIDEHILHPETMDELVKEGKWTADMIPDINRYEKLSDVFITKAGDCVMRPGLFAGMCRILKVPARVILVFVYHGFDTHPEGFLDGAHGLSEVYDPEQKEWIQTNLIPENKLWSNHHYSIVCEYYTREDKPDNYANLMFLTQDAIKMGDAECARWKVTFVE